ncbi:MAG: hypothetical protein Q4D79_00045 [Propionibacteriaceae bacterium]|nr:hypothetical protein [Propionibacteriaceae bacterium]
MATTASPLRPVEAQRDRFGRPLVIPPGGGQPIPYTRCTTFIDALEDKYNLQKWMQRMVAVGIGLRPDLHASAASLAPDPDDNKASLDELCKTAKASAKATIGTALHGWVERLNRGEDPGPVPAQWQPHIDAYRTKVLPQLGQPRTVEAFCVNDELQVGGTPDLITPLGMELQRQLGRDGAVVCDLKTGPNTLRYGALKVAMQLAVYAHSHLYDPETGKRTPHGAHTDKGLVIALDSDTADLALHWVDLEAGWEAVQVCARVRDWRKRKDLLTEISGETLSTPTTTADATAALPAAPSRVASAAPTNLDSVTAALHAAISVSPTREALLDLWRKAGPAWSDSHTAAAKQRLQQLTQPTN